VTQLLSALPETRAARIKVKACVECGCDFTPGAAHGDFCSSPCRKGFNNRRALRGAELYDLFMVLRYERDLAKKLHVWKILCRMAMGFRAEDQAQRDGRKSWRPARQVIDRRADLHATVVATNIMGRRPS
jgi:hypothetical protein